MDNPFGPKKYSARKPARTKKRSGQPESVAGVLPIVGRALNLDQKAREWGVLSLWSQLVDPMFQENTKAMRIQKKGNRNCLGIAVRSSAVAAELSFYTEAYRERMNGYKAETGIEIHQIDIRPAPSAF